MKTNTWICDSCGSEIKDASHGWVEWLNKLEDGKRTSRGLRLVHHCTHSPRGGHHKCQYDGQLEFRKDGCTISDMELKYFLGPDGLMELLSMMDENEAPQIEIIEMIKRLHIPGYEHARLHFDEAIGDGAFEPNTRPGFYPTRDINATLEWLKKQN